MTLRAIVVGAGRRGTEWMATLDQHSGFELVGVVEPVAEVTAAPGVQVIRSDDVGAAISELTPDCAIVATPPDAHVPPTTALLDAHVPVLVEKPLAVGLDEGRELVDIARRAGVPLLVGMNHRYLRSHRTVRAVLDRGEIGRVHAVSAHYLRTPHEMAPSLASLEDQVLWGMAVHHLDAIRHVLRREVTAVVGDRWTAPWTDALPGASLHALLELEDGIHVTYSATYESSGRRTFEGGQEFYERVIGERGTIHVLQRWVFVWGRARLPRSVRRGPRRNTEEHVLLDQLRDAVVDGIDVECSGADHLRTLAVTEAFRRSCVEGRRIDPRELLADG